MSFNTISDGPARAAGGVAAFFRIVVGFLLALSGLGMAAPGGYLLSLGGSPYYLIAGVLIFLAAMLIMRGSRAGPQLYGLVFLSTVAWGLVEVGFAGWALLPRLVFLGVAGIVLFVLVPRRTLAPAGPQTRLILRIALILVLIGLAAGVVLAVRRESQFVAGRWEGTVPVPAEGAPVVTAGDWTQYGGTARGSRYSALDEITPANAASLERAWTFGVSKPGGPMQGGMEVTPLMIDGLVYGCTSAGSIFALDPVTGKQLWRHETAAGAPGRGFGVCRGLGFYRAPAAVAECRTRLLLGTGDSRLVAIDAKTGEPCRKFGVDGAVNLRDGMGDFPTAWSRPTSPPTIVNGVAIVGQFVIDNQSAHAPPGVIRGYDAVTGKLKWAFDPGRPDDQKPVAPGGAYTPSTPNSWTIASADEALGLVYIPMGNGSPDFVGIERTPETDRFSTALVALEAATGKVRWVFQAVHHDLWDYDLAAQPVLADFPTPAGPVPAVYQATKTGQVFVLDRRDGRPLTMVEERPVPKSEVPGETSSPTQPFSTGMPDFAGGALTEADMWGITPFDQLSCRIRFRQARYDGIYTTPRLGKTIRYPGELGGIDWGSMSVDEGRSILVVNSNHMADMDELITRDQAEREARAPKPPAPKSKGKGPRTGPMTGTPFAIHWGPFLSAIGVPCQRPPYGFLTAVDLQTQKIIWRRPLGDARNSGPLGKSLRLPLSLGAPNIGGSVASAGGVIFIGASQDEMFRAIDTATGETLFEDQMPAAGHATPMTYRGADGHQYVLIAAGGRALRDKPGDLFIAYRLKKG